MKTRSWIVGSLVALGCSGGASSEQTALDKRIDALEADLSEANETIAGLSEADAQASARQDALESQTASVDARVSALEAGATDLQSSVEAIEAQLSDTSSLVNLLSIDVQTLTDDQDAVAASLESLQEGLSSAEDGLSSAQNTLSSLDTRVSSLESDVLGLSSSVDSLESSAASIATLTLGTVSSITGTDTTVHDLGALTVDPPGAGQLVVFLTGHAIFFGQGRTIDIGIGDSATVLDTSVDIGDLDGTGTLRTESSFAATATYNTTGAPVTLHALAQGNTVFDNVSVNIVPQQLTVVFVPETM